MSSFIPRWMPVLPADPTDVWGGVLSRVVVLEESPQGLGRFLVLKTSQGILQLVLSVDSDISLRCLLPNPADLESVKLPEKSADSHFPRPLADWTMTFAAVSRTHKRSADRVVKQVWKYKGINIIERQE